MARTAKALMLTLGREGLASKAREDRGLALVARLVGAAGGDRGGDCSCLRSGTWPDAGDWSGRRRAGRRAWTGASRSRSWLSM